MCNIHTFITTDKFKELISNTRKAFLTHLTWYMYWDCKHKQLTGVVGRTPEIEVGVYKSVGLARGRPLAEFQLPVLTTQVSTLTPQGAPRRTLHGIFIFIEVNRERVEMPSDGVSAGLPWSCWGLLVHMPVVTLSLYDQHQRMANLSQTKFSNCSSILLNELRNII